MTYRQPAARSWRSGPSRVSLPGGLRNFRERFRPTLPRVCLTVRARAEAVGLVSGENHSVGSVAATLGVSWDTGTRACPGDATHVLEPTRAAGGGVRLDETLTNPSRSHTRRCYATLFVDPDPHWVVDVVEAVTLPRSLAGYNAGAVAGRDLAYHDNGSRPRGPRPNLDVENMSRSLAGSPPSTTTALGACYGLGQTWPLSPLAEPEAPTLWAWAAWTYSCREGPRNSVRESKTALPRLVDARSEGR